MIENFIYAGASGIVERGSERTVRFAPNLAREIVAFDAELRHPIRFREAISAMHDVVISDLRFLKRDKSAYLQWKLQQSQRERALAYQAHQQAVAEADARRAIPLPGGFEKQYHEARQHYWSARQSYSTYLEKHDPALWRQLLPCDPVITVADDVVFFECFSKDESAYASLSVNRERGFGQSAALKLGTTNVDYSRQLYEQFQTLRTYRHTRFSIDPEGFEVRTQTAPGHREEKIDLPVNWLRGFMKLQAAMTMPTTRVPLTHEAVYSLLAFLQRNKARTSPRALRFELEPGKNVRMALEPWQKVFDVHGAPYQGPPTSPIRIWGTRRLLVLARLLPLIDSIEVHLLDSGLPSFWVAHVGEMTFTLALSGWTTNDWAGGSGLDMLQPPRALSPQIVDRVSAEIRARRAADLARIKTSVADLDEFTIAAALRQLAQSGQVIFDLSTRQFRYRQIMSQPLGEAQLGPEDPELAAARMLVDQQKFELVDRQDGPNLTRVIIGRVESKPVEILVDPEDRIKRGKCLCGHFKQYGMRNGPCRHMIALRWGVSAHGLRAFQQSDWYNRVLGRNGAV